MKDQLFIFNGKYYEQHDGVSMGSPLGPSYANAFLSYYEQKWINSASVKPRFYRRYVDDTYLLFNSTNNANSFLEYLNCQHPNIKFTCDFENDRKEISFIGIRVIRCEDKFLTSVFHKATDTGLFIHFDSFCNSKFKANTFKVLVQRAVSLCSSWKLMADEIDFLMAKFYYLNYPSDLLHRIVNQVLHDFVKNNGNKEKSHNVKKKEVFCVLPYRGQKPSSEIKNKINSIIAKTTAPVKVNVTFKSVKINELVRSTEEKPDLVSSKAVYLFTCPKCPSEYIGVSSRYLYIRYREHLSSSSSSIYQHLMTHDEMDINSLMTCFSILAKGSHKYDLLIKEAILISQRQPALNTQKDSIKLSLL